MKEIKKYSQLAPINIHNEQFVKPNNKFCLQTRHIPKLIGQFSHLTATHQPLKDSKKIQSQSINQYQNFNDKKQKSQQTSPKKISQVFDSKMRKQNNCENPEHQSNLTLEKSTFIKNYTEKLKRQRKRQEKKNNKKAIKDDQILKKWVNAEIISQKQNYRIKGSEYLPEKSTAISTFNWPDKNKDIKHIAERRRIYSPEIQRKFKQQYNNTTKIRSNTPQTLNRLTKSIVLDPQQEYKERFNHLCSVMDQFEPINSKRCRKNKKNTATQSKKDKNKFDPKNLEPWKNQDIFLHKNNSKNHQKIQDFGIEEYYYNFKRSQFFH